jgi:2-oxo-4-hydroxy-4-carboxy-5-ureidoimidazoline decarboxylase
MTQVLAQWNEASTDAAVAQILSCCGSTAWAREMARRRPFHEVSSLPATSDDVWGSLTKADWMEAFLSHPRIGESKATDSSSPNSVAWATQEQQKVADTGDAVKIALAEGNREYEKKFGHLFIVCATGKSAPEMLEILQRRMRNNAEVELHEAAEQQRQIMQIRLRKWLYG